MTGQTDGSQLPNAMQSHAEIRRINQQWVDAVVRKDTVTLNSLMDEGCVFSYALEGDDRDQFITDIVSGDLQVASLKRENVEIRIYGSTGVLVAFDTADWRYKGRHIQGYYRTMHVYAERDGRWQIVAVQASPIAA